MITHRWPIVIILAILIFPVIKAQDITGDWYGIRQAADSLLITLHIYKDHNGLKGIMDSPSQGAFGIPMDEITLEEDTLFFRISTVFIKHKGFVNNEYSKICGEVNQFGHVLRLDFSRKKIIRSIPVNYNSMTTVPAKVRVIETRTPERVPYTGIKRVKAGTPEVIQIDTSRLKVLTPGKNGVASPIVYKLPEPKPKDEFSTQQGWKWSPTIIKAKQTRPFPAQPIQMKEAAICNIQYLDLENGLIDPEIWSILEDSKGNMWFGSYNTGICKYDGKVFDYYTAKEGLTHNGIRAMIEDRSGNIWISTNWGLCKYDGNYFTQYALVELFRTILSVLESGDGNIWLGTQDVGVIEKKGNFCMQYTENEGLTNNTVRSVLEDRYGNLWFGTDQGVCKFNGVSFTHFTENEGLISNKVRSIIEDRQGNLWFGTEQGVSKYDGISFRQYTENEGLSLNYINSIIEDKSGYLWFGTFGGGVNMYDGNTFTHYTSKEGLISDDILSIKEDGYGNIWLTTMEGIMKFQRNSFTYYTQLEDIAKGKVTSIVEDRKGNIWFGFLTGGLIKYDGKSFETITESEGLNNIPVRSMLGDENGNIWFTTDNNSALQKYDGKSITIYDNKKIWNSNFGEFISEDKKGNIWIGTWGEGLKKFDGESFTDFYGITYCPDTYVTSVLQDDNGNVWYGSVNAGLFKYNDEFITQYTINEGLSGMWITALFEDKSGNLWIGTQDGGVNKFDGQSFEYFLEEEGLINNSISSIIGDNKGNIWVGTKKGLSLLSPHEDGNYSTISFGTEDGLKNLNFNNHSVCLDSRNRLWWGTGDIITMLDLNSYEINTKPPVIQLNNILLNQKYIDFRALLPGIKETEQSPSDTSTRMNLRGLKFSDVAPFYNYPVDLELPHYLNNLTFNFSAIDWAAPQSIKYQYMVEGMDKEWNPMSTENKADYRNIPSGKYTFKVKAIITANIWSETFEYPFTVRPPLWFRWWAYIFYAMVLILLVRYYIRYRVSRERIKAEIQIKQVEVDKMQELDQMKSRFFANISHEFRTPLTLIIGPIEDLFKRKPKRAELTWDIMGIMHRNAKRLQKLINQLLDLSKLETGEVKLQVSEGNFEEFLRAIIFSFLSLAESKRIKYEYNLPGTNEQLYFDSDKVEKITTNLISNALKFTPEGGSVIVTLEYSREDDDVSRIYAEIRIKDSGPGIPDDEKEKIFDRFYQVSSSDSRDHEGSGIGLALTRELVELYRGKIHVESEPGKGSTFTLKLPVSRVQFKEGEIIAVSEKPAVTKFFDEHEVLVHKAATSGVKKETFKEKDKDLPIILIVEDNADLRKYISGNLFSQYQILEAENGREGLNKAIESIPDLVISDLMMPEMDGMEMCDRLKKDPRTNHIPLIMLTAKADRDSKLEGLETGADDYIIKPFDAEELKVRIKNLIEQRKKLREHYRKEFLTDPADHEIPPPEDEFLVRVLDCTKKHLEDPEFGVEQMGKELNMSRIQLYRKVRSLTDYTPSEFIRTFRLKMAARMFLEGHKNVTSVLYTVGFNTPSHFTQSFREMFGLNPSEYIKQKTKSGK